MSGALDGLPGAELVRRGHTSTKEALIVAMAPSLLESLGVAYPREAGAPMALPELALDALLCGSEPDPYSAYNALRRRFDRFVRALTARRARGASALSP